MEIIASKSNEKVKYIKSLNDKKFRQRYKAFYLEGIKVVMEVIEMKEAINIEFIAYSKSMLSKVKNSNTVLDFLENEGEIKKYEFEESVFKTMVDTVTPQGILIVVKIPDLDIQDMYKRIKGNVLIIDRVQDSGNLGTIIRTCDAFNVRDIICTTGTADAFSNKVTRSTMGSILRANIVYLKEDKLLEFMDKLVAKDYKIISTSLKSKKSIEEIDMSGNLAIVVGNESCGVSKNILDKSTVLAKIPMSGTAESLNVAVATGILLYNQYKNK